MITKREFFKQCIEAFNSTQEYKNMKYPSEFYYEEIYKSFRRVKHLKLVQEYKNYARYVDMKTGLYECFSKVDFKNGTGIEVIE